MLQNDLIYDVGLHKGEDTDYYLKKGFRVVAFEADPDLARHCGERFSAEITAGRLTIVEGAILDPSDARRTVVFFKNSEKSVWGTVHETWAGRNAGVGRDSVRIEVPRVDFADALRRYGVPHYLKIDIEGSDMVCVRELCKFEQRPTYLSIESSKTRLSEVREEIAVLVSLGYTGFQAVEQGVIGGTLADLPGQPKAHRFPNGSSGGFGADLPEGWQSAEHVLRHYRFIHFGYWLLGETGVLRKSGLMAKAVARVLRMFTRGTVPGWYDTHARHSTSRLV